MYTKLRTGGVVVALLLAFGLSACGQEDERTVPSSPEGSGQGQDDDVNGDDGGGVGDGASDHDDAQGGSDDGAGSDGGGDGGTGSDGGDAGDGGTDDSDGDDDSSNGDDSGGDAGDGSADDGGDGSDGDDSDSDSDNDGDDSSAQQLEVFFAEHVQPELEFCRTCHKPGGLADSEDGAGYMLDQDSSHDLANFRSSWQRLGGNNPVSRILLMASGQESHSGGTPWQEGGETYTAVEVVFDCFEDEEACAAQLGGDSDQESEPRQEEPLLGSRHGGHAWFDFCEDQPDSAELPPDPRSLVQPGVSEGRAVHFNAYWVDCHADPELVDEAPPPRTCGELRASWEHGERLMRGNGGIGSGTFFNGDAHESFLAIPADAYNRLWRQWAGIRSRPGNFDELVSQRYGMPIGEARNPYPLPGEDPNQSDGGSGQLPIFMTQFREPDGTWTGRLGFTCHSCHSGAAGTRAEGMDVLYGSGNSHADIALMAREIGVAARSPGGIFSLFGKSRGTNNASAVNLFFLLNQDSGFRFDEHIYGMVTSGSTASGDTPAWWNVGSRPLKFQDGYFAADASRVDLIFYTPLDGVLGGASGERWVRENAPHADRWIMSLDSPEYPLEVDADLARQGAILFHSKDLWAEQLENPVPRPEGGNGSCASCHGAYSPRFVNDPDYLATPALDGIAANVVPQDVIGTDPARLETNNESVAQYGSTSFLGYSETVGTENDCGPQTRAEIRGEHRERGYLAPPLYGVWATAPYFHNGSVPTVWDLLDAPEQRPDLWRRVSAPARPDQEGRVVMGFDYSLERAYDETRMGWDYEVVQCGEAGMTPFLRCTPRGDKPAIQRILDQLYGNFIGAWNLGNWPIFTQVSNRQIENRKVYNTHFYSQGNQGHDFTAVLTDQERRALIEYLKTL